MAIVQISRIQIRRGLNQDLPQLASAEMGWSVDTQQLYIGNGTIAEGAPKTGVTEILTTASLAQLTSALTANIASAQANLQAYVGAAEANVASFVSNVEAAIGAVVSTNLSHGASSSGPIAIFSGNDAVMTYSLNQGGTRQRTGTLKASRIGNSVVFDDDYNETSTSDIIINVTANSSYGNINYTTTTATTISYTLRTY